MKEFNQKDFGKLSDGTKTTLYTLENDLGDKVQISDYGATLVAWRIEENDSEKNIVWGYDDVTGYEEDVDSYFGATVGPYANRISNGGFRLNNEYYKLGKNDGNNTLHSADLTFHNKVWELIDAKNHSLTFAHHLNDDDYPGNIDVRVTYSYDNNRNLSVKYDLESDADTLINLTNHSYFNIDDSQNIYDQSLEINANFYTVIDDESISTGEILSVAGSEYDYTELKNLSSIENGRGLDNNFVLHKEEQEEFTYAARVVDAKKEKQLVCFTKTPGIQVYTANYTNGVKGSDGRLFEKHGAICLETQYFPDAPNIAHFDPNKVEANVPFTSETIYVYTDFIDIEDED